MLIKSLDKKKKSNTNRFDFKKNNLKIIPLGGLDEIGKNITVFEYENEIILVDCGLEFPEDDMLGIDLVIPDVTYLEKNKDKIKGLVITHGHEDHIGAIPYIFKKINIPIYATRLTAGLIKNKLEEHNLLSSTKLNIVEQGQTINFGNIKIEFIRSSHSIPDSVMLAIHTPVGVILHTGDFKVDFTPIDDQIMDLGRIAELGNKGILALMSDSTNSERKGYTMSESTVGDVFERLFQNNRKRIVVATFASNVHRVQQIVNSAKEHNRKIAVCGRSMINMINTAREIGYMFGQYKKLKNEFTGVLTGKGLSYGGSLGRTEATGYGLCYYTNKMLEVMKNTSFKNKKVIISGSGNVALYAMQKAQELGAIVIAMSDSNGYIYNEKGLNFKFLKELKEVKRLRISEYLKFDDSTTYVSCSKDIWKVKCDIALPCATQNELTLDDAKILVSNGVIAIGEGANMPCTLEATDYFIKNEILFGPAKAANAGGVMVSGFEMSQNSMRYAWSFEEVDNKLKTQMENIFLEVLECATHYNDKYNFVLGANISGFKKVANAMIAQGVC